MKLFVGNIPDGVSEEDLRQVFAEFGAVTHCRLLVDAARPTIAFVHMAHKQDADDAIRELHGRDWDGYQIRVQEAHDRSGGRN